MVDFSKPETRQLYRDEVKRRMDEFGMSRDQAEMLVAALMTEPPGGQTMEEAAADNFGLTADDLDEDDAP